MKYTIRTPNRFFNGLRLDVEFRDGVGHTDDDSIVKDFLGYGYEVETTDTPKKPSRKRKAVTEDG